MSSEVHILVLASHFSFLSGSLNLPSLLAFLVVNTSSVILSRSWTSAPLSVKGPRNRPEMKYIEIPSRDKHGTTLGSSPLFVHSDLVSALPRQLEWRDLGFVSLDDLDVFTFVTLDVVDCFSPRIGRSGFGDGPFRIRDPRFRRRCEQHAGRVNVRRRASVQSASAVERRGRRVRVREGDVGRDRERRRRS